MKNKESFKLTIPTRTAAKKNKLFFTGVRKNTMIELRSEAKIRVFFLRGLLPPGSVEGLPLTSGKAAKRFGTR